MSSTSVYPPSNANTDDTSEEWDKRADLMWKICGPILLTIGVPGNLTTIVILYSITTKSIAFIFFKALCTTDLLFLLTGCMSYWIKHQFGTHPKDTGLAMCVAYKLMGYTLGRQSALILMMLTAHRAFVTVNAPRAIRLCTRRRVRRAIAAVVFVSFATCLYIPFAIEHRGGKCLWRKTFREDNVDNSVSRWANATLFSIIPAAVIVYSNFLIIQKLRASDRKVRAASVNRDIAAGNKKISRVTLSVTFLSSLFILLSCPLTILNLRALYNPDLNSDHCFTFLKDVGKVLLYVNSCVNFMFYAWASTNFREKARTSKLVKKTSKIGKIKIPRPSKRDYSDWASSSATSLRSALSTTSWATYSASSSHIALTKNVPVIHSAQADDVRTIESASSLQSAQTDNMRMIERASSLHSAHTKNVQTTERASSLHSTKTKKVLIVENASSLHSAQTDNVQNI